MIPLTSWDMQSIKGAVAHEAVEDAGVAHIALVHVAVKDRAANHTAEHDSTFALWFRHVHIGGFQRGFLRGGKSQ